MPTLQTNAALIRSLQSSIQGEIRFDKLSCQLYSTDASDYQKLPVGVVIPKTRDDIQAVVRIAGQFRMPVIVRGGGSSLSGQSVGPGLIVDLSKYFNHILEINESAQWADVAPGVVLDVLNNRLMPHGLMVGPDPSSAVVATIGGMTGNNSTGSHSIRYGMMLDHIRELDVVLADGSLATFKPHDFSRMERLTAGDSLEARLYRQTASILETYENDIASGWPRTWRNVAGYNLKRVLEEKRKDGRFSLIPLMVGSEGTLGIITRIRVGLVPRPAVVRLMILHYDALDAALSQVPFILDHQPSAVELITRPTLQLAWENQAFRPALETFVKGIPGGILIVEFAGENSAAIEKQANALEAALAGTGYDNPVVHCITPEQMGHVWSVRKSTLGLMMSRPGDEYRRISAIDDATVPVDRLPDFAREVLAAGEEMGISLNFDGHASAGCLHTGPPINLKTAQGLSLFERLSQKIIDIAIAHQGTTTGEHGEGLARSFFSEQLHGRRLYQAFREIKQAFDPQNIFNPHKMTDAPPPWDKSWLKYSPDYARPFAPKKTTLNFSSHGDFAGLVEMCNGQGVCRAQLAGSMCPSFRVTGEELHTTRGRANALRAAITGQLGDEGLTNAQVYDAMDLCLACKACRNECSTRVDMAKLKFEFLSQYQARHGVPLRSRMVGHLEHSSRMAGILPRIANYFYKSSLFRTLLEKTVQIDRRRQLPPVAPVSFQDWFARRTPPSSAPLGPVVLWDDCHLSYHQPELGKAAVHILEAAGFDVRLISGRRCCGRPLISKGLLKTARQYARHNISLLAGYARKGTPIVGVEPSCISCFRDEYPDLVNHSDARLIAKNTFFIEEFIADLMAARKARFSFRTLPPETILLHTHCYQKALGTAEPVRQMLEQIPGVQVAPIDSGCCGMAGSFGYEKEHYETSMAIGELSLFPAVRNADPAARIAAPGTSCREQIKDGTGRQAAHPVLFFASALATHHQ